MKKRNGYKIYSSKKFNTFLDSISVGLKDVLFLVSIIIICVGFQLFSFFKYTHFVYATRILKAILIVILIYILLYLMSFVINFIFKIIKSNNKPGKRMFGIEGNVLVSFLILIFLIYLDVHNPINTDIKNCCDKKEITTIILTSLLPTIVSIITIILSLGKESIDGLTRVEFNRLRKKGRLYINIFEFIFISILLFSFAFIFDILDYDFHRSLICLNIFTIFLSIYLITQEIPVLMQNRWFLNKIEKSIMKDYINSKTINYSEIKNKALINKIFIFRMVEEGTDIVYHSLKSKRNKEYNDKIIEELFSFYKDFIKTMNLDKDSISPFYSDKEYEGINVLKILNQTPSNISFFLINQVDKFYFISSCIGMFDDFKSIIKEANRTKLEEECLKDYLKILLTSIEERDNFSFYTSYNLANYYLLDSFDSKENYEWWFNLLRKNEYDSFYNFSDHSYYLYVLIYVFYKSTLSKYESNCKDIIKIRFGNNENFKDLIKREILEISSDRIFNQLNYLLNLYEYNFMFRAYERDIYGNLIENDFNQEFIMKSYIELLSCIDLHGRKIKIDISDLNDENYKRFKNIFIKDNALKVEYSGIAFFYELIDKRDLKKIDVFEYLSKESILEQIKNRDTLISAQKSEEQTNLFDKKVKSKSVFKKLKKDILFSKKIKIDKNCVPVKDYKTYNTLYDKTINDFSLVLKREISKEIGSKIVNVTNLAKNFDELENKMNKKRHYYTNDYELFNQLKDEYKIEFYDTFNIDKRIVFTEGDISFNFTKKITEYDFSEDKDNKIDEIIKKYYKFDKGCYKYIILNNPSDFLLLNYDGLKEQIKKDYVILNFEFNYGVNIKDKNIIVYDDRDC